MRKHKVKINTETEFGYVMKHLHKIKPTFISIFSSEILICLRCYIKHLEECFIRISKHLEVVKKQLLGVWIKHTSQHTSRCLNNLMKHSSSCLIYYFLHILHAQKSAPSLPHLVNKTRSATGFCCRQPALSCRLVGTTWNKSDKLVNLVQYKMLTICSRFVKQLPGTSSANAF